MINTENLNIQFFRGKSILLENSIKIDVDFLKNSLEFSNKKLSSTQINLFSELLSEAYLNLKIYKSNILSGTSLFDSLKLFDTKSLPIESDFLKKDFSFVSNIKVLEHRSFFSKDFFTQKKNDSFPKIFSPSLEIIHVDSKDRFFNLIPISIDILFSNLMLDNINFDEKALLKLYFNEDCNQIYNKLKRIIKKILSLHKAKKVICKVENIISYILHDNLFYIYPNDTEDNRVALFM